MKDIIPVESIVSKIIFLRGEKVLLDRDLADLYGVETGASNRAVKRNFERFPNDFMFQLSAEEAELLRCQIGISKVGRGGRRYLPYAFTEQGVAMLSSVLKSRQAVEVNIAIMRAFVKLREMIATHEELARRLSEMEEHSKDHDEQIQAIFEVIRQLMSPAEKPQKVYPVKSMCAA